MVDFPILVQCVDTLCEFFVGTFSTGLQLIYKLAHKVNAVANPVKTSWIDDIKIHVLSKSKFECFIGMIPVLGGISKLVDLIKNGFRDNFMKALKLNNIEVIKLFLARHPLKDTKQAIKYLLSPASSSSPEGFKLIFHSRLWDLASIIKILLHTSASNDFKNINTFLDYYEKHFNNTKLTNDQISRLVEALSHCIEDKHHEAAIRIVKLLPSCDYQIFGKILTEHLCFCSSPEEKESLTCLIDEIIKRCKPCSLTQLTEHCKKALNTYLSLKRESSSIRLNIIEKLLEKAEKECDPPAFANILYFLIQRQENEIIELFLNKFWPLLRDESKQFILLNIITSCSFLSPSYSSLSKNFFLEKYSKEFTDDQYKAFYLSVRTIYSDLLLRNQLKQMRPHLELDPRPQVSLQHSWGNTSRPHTTNSYPPHMPIGDVYTGSFSSSDFTVSNGTKTFNHPPLTGSGVNINSNNGVDSGTTVGGITVSIGMNVPPIVGSGTLGTRRFDLSNHQLRAVKLQAAGKVTITSASKERVKNPSDNPRNDDSGNRVLAPGGPSHLVELQPFSNGDAKEESVVLDKPPTQYVEITADDNLLEHLKPSVQGKHLVLNVQNAISTQNPIAYHLHISLTSLRSLVLSGAGSIEVDQLDVEELESQISGSFD